MMIQPLVHGIWGIVVCVFVYRHWTGEIDCNDQGTPVPLRRFLTGHIIDTAYERGWSELSNGNLLKRAEQEGYKLLITGRKATTQKPGF